MNDFIKKINIKKTVIIYLVSTFMVLMGTFIFIGYQYREKLSFLYYYHQIHELLDEDGNVDKAKDIISQLSDNQDIIDILLLDNENHITFSLNKSSFFNENVLNLQRVNNTDYLQIEGKDNVYLKFVRKDELVFHSLFSGQYEHFRDDYEDQVFFENQFNQKDVYLLNYISTQNGDKVYFISQIQPVENGELYVKIALAIIVFLFMIYWILVALMVYRSALILNLNPYYWGGITLITNMIGVIIYVFYKQQGVICPKCGSYHKRENKYCTLCGEKIVDTCESCDAIIHKKDKYCPQCGKKIEEKH